MAALKGCGCCCRQAGKGAGRAVSILLVAAVQRAAPQLSGQAERAASACGQCCYPTCLPEKVLLAAVSMHTCLLQPACPCCCCRRHGQRAGAKCRLPLHARQQLSCGSAQPHHRNLTLLVLLLLLLARLLSKCRRSQSTVARLGLNSAVFFSDQIRQYAMPQRYQRAPNSAFQHRPAGRAQHAACARPLSVIFTLLASFVLLGTPT